MRSPTPSRPLWPWLVSALLAALAVGCPTTHSTGVTVRPDAGCAACTKDQLCIQNGCLATSCNGVTCPQGKFCNASGVCVAPSCDGDPACGPGKACVQGSCFELSCGATPCAEDEVCVGGACTARSCANVPCGQGQLCANGQCRYRDCAQGPCPSGMVCDSGRCTSTRCVGVTCGGDATCVNGQCLPTSCSGQLCEQGLVCVNGACVDASCAGATCPSGSACVKGACQACTVTAASCTGGQDADCGGAADCRNGQCNQKPCNTGNACLTSTSCQADGTCGAGTLKACPPGGSCLQAGSCNPASGACAYQPLAAGAACNGPRACGQGGTCDGAGTCKGATATDCPPPPGGGCWDTGTAGTCDPTTGLCTYTPKAAGQSCDDGNACTLGDHCDGQGRCVAGTQVACAPPSATSCTLANTCDPTTGQCVAAPKPKGAPCEDGNGCSVGDTCDGASHCIAGPTCPVTDACQTRTCVNNACVAGPNKADGTGCPGEPSVCCQGHCVNTSTDVHNCGGCGLGCAAGHACEPSNNLTCTDPARVPSGRCLCTAADSQCPKGQLCRTVAPYTNRCTPPSAANCATREKVEALNSCPDYCRY